VRHDVVQPDLHRSATVERAGLHADGTRLALHDGRVVQVAALPDPEGCRRVHTVLRRVERVDLRIAATGVTAVVIGIGHRRQCQLPVSLGTALALMLAGDPCAVTVAEAGQPAGATA
jgi:hypothetical protein